MSVKKRKNSVKKENRIAYLFVAPALILFILFVGYPLIASAC